VKKTQILQITLGLLLAGGGFYFFFTNVDINKLWLNMIATPPWAIASVVVLTICTLWLRSVRWNVMLPQTPRASRRDLFGIVMISFMINNFIPARIGEAARVVLLWKRNNFTLGASVGSVLLERIFDTVVFLSFLFIPLFFLPSLRGNSLAFKFAVPLAAIVAAVLCVLVFYALAPAWVKSIGRKLLPLFPEKIRPKIISISGDLVSNLDWIFSPKKCFAVFILSIAIVSCHAVMFLFLGNDKNFGLLSGMFGAASAALGAAVPLAPGYFGTLHAAVQKGLVMTGCEANKAGAIAAIYHTVSYLTVSIVGLYFFFKMKISFKDIGRAKQSIKEIARQDQPSA
jgi:uncharacterized protein (TIRG00374 family)